MNKEYVYVIGRPDGPVKVGISRYPYGRVNSLQTGCPFPLELLHAQPMRDRSHALQHERNFHEVYAEKRLSGEWFDIDAELAIECIETALEIEAHFEGLS
jgi:hypothetical protein